MGCKLHEAEEIGWVVLPAHQEPALPLNPGKEAFDDPASLVTAQPSTILGLASFDWSDAARSSRCPAARNAASSESLSYARSPIRLSGLLRSCRSRRSAGRA